MSNLLPVHNYPNFVANQVLTNTQLNNMFEYLDSQNRLTRIRLIGTGIVCGLNARFENTGDELRLIISEGYGVTSDGYLVHLPETEYNQIRSYQDSFHETEDIPLYPPFMVSEEEMIPLQELISDPLPKDFINLPPAAPLAPEDLDGKALILYLEKQTEDLKSCFTTDCNNKGQEILLKVRILLADKDQLAELPNWADPEGNCHELGAQIHAPRLFAGIMVTADAAQKRLYQIADSGEMLAAYRDIAAYLREEILEKVDTFFNDDAFKIFLHLFDQSERVDALADQLAGIVEAPDFSQYHYDVLKDITQAYNEFARQYCEIIAPCCPPGNFPCHLVLHDLTVSENEEGDISFLSTPGYRHRFYPSPVRNVQRHELEKTQKLFRRMLALAFHFNVPRTGAEQIRITPSQHEGYSLGERAVPYYYIDDDGQLPEEIRQLWPSQICCNATPLSYAGNTMAPPQPADEDPQTIDYAEYAPNPLHFNINGHSLYRIEGYLGNTYGDVINRLQRIRRLFNLEFSILPLYLNEVQVTVPPEILSNINSSWNTIHGLWQSIYNLALTPDFSEERYNGILAELQNWEAALAEGQARWQNWRDSLFFPCDLSSLQSDYLILRSELLGLLRKIRPLLGTRPGVSAAEPRQVCLNFESLDPQATFGRDENEEGDEIFVENNVRVSAEFFSWGDGRGTFGRAFVQLQENGQQAVWFNNINLKFNFADLDFTPDQVTFLAGDFGGFENLAVNDLPVSVIEFRSSTTEREIAPGVTFVYTPAAAGSTFGVGTLRGNIRNFTVGGQEFLLLNVCANGVQTTTDGLIQSIELSIREEKLRQRTRLLIQALPREVAHFNFPLFSRAFKDWSDTAIQIKLIFCKLFDAAENDILPYENFPRWQEYLWSLNVIHYACLYSRLSALYYTVNGLLTPSFRHFAARHPGLEHRAGVAPGGAFILLCESTEGTDLEQAAVVADFSLQSGHCCCPVDPENCLPPVALPDYRIIEVSDEPADLLIDVRDNDIDLHDAQEVIIQAGGTSALGIPFSVSGQQILYRYSQVNNPQAFAGRIDHFSYSVFNANCNLEDRGNVWILFKGVIEAPPPVGPGRITGSVFYNDLEQSILVEGATVRVEAAERNERLSGTQTNARGDFSLTLEAGVYNLEISYRCFRRRLTGIQVNNEETNAVGPVELSLAPPKRVEPASRVIVNDNDLRAGRSYQWTKNNVYILNGAVYLEQGSVLNIEPGTIIKGRTVAGNRSASALIVTRGAKINAKGSSQEPIMFTSEEDDLSRPDDLTPNQDSFWGGLIILGNAPIGEDPGPGRIPSDVLDGFSANDERNIYGGSDANDSSGILTHVSIRYAGITATRVLELGALTLAGVGAATTVDYIEIFTCVNNGVNLFGGTVNIKHVVSAFCIKNALQSDEAWNGNGQFWFALQHEQIGALAGRHEGSESRDRSPHTLPGIYNATLIGSGLRSNNNTGSALHMLNDGTVRYGNSIITEFPGIGLRLGDSSLKSYLARIYEIRNNIWFGFNQQRLVNAEGAESQVIERLIQDKNDLQANPQLRSISRTTDQKLDPRPRDGSPALKNLGPLPDNRFFESVNYRGAFAPDQLMWIKCWTALDEYGFLPRGGDSVNIRPIDILDTRVDDRRAVINDLTTNISEANQPALADSQDFILAGAVDANTPIDKVNETYGELAGALIKSTDSLRGQDKNQANQILREVSHAYFDRLVAENPEKLDPSAKKLIKEMVKTMKKAGISTNRLMNEWKSNDLKNIVGADNAINEIRTILKEG